MLDSILAVLAVTSLGINLWQFIAAWFFPLNRKTTDPEDPVGVTILKPLKGRDGRSRECLRSWFTLRYAGPIQILLGVRDRKDPIIEVVHQLLEEFPRVNARLIMCPEWLGPNAKVSTLAQLEPLIEHSIVVVSDADVRVPYHYLNSVVPRFRDPKVGLVCNFYRLANPNGLAMYWEAVVVNVDFWTQVLLSRQLTRMRFALGAVMATPRETLRKIGGFAPLVDFLADDYQLGNRISHLPARIELSPIVVDCWEFRGRWGQVWDHQVRWARTIRVCQPISYFFSIITAVTVWSFLWYFFSDLALQWFGGIVLMRMVMAGLLCKRIKGGAGNPCNVWIVGLVAPFKDILSTLVWIAAFTGGRVHWRGTNYRVKRNGRMVVESRG